MPGTQLLRHRVQLHLFFQQFVVSMPLNEIRAPHESSVLGRAPVVMPQIKQDEIDRLLIWLRPDNTVLPKASDKVLSLLYLFIRRANDLLSLRINALDEGTRMTLIADLLHVELGLLIVGAMLRDRIGEEVGEPLTRVVSHFLAVNAGHVARGAGRNKHIASGQGARIGRQIEAFLLSGKQDSVPGLLVDFDLGMVGTHVTLAASARETRHGYRARVARVTRGAISNGSVILRFTNGVTLRATAANSRRALQLCKSISGPLHITRVIFLREISLFRRKTFFTKDCGP